MTWVCRHFSPEEFNCPDWIDPVVLAVLDEMRHLAGESFTPTSDGRDPARNAAAGGTSESLHLFDPDRGVFCKAVDWAIQWKPRPTVWEQIERIVAAWETARRLSNGRGTELEIVYRPAERCVPGEKPDMHFHLGVFPNARAHRLVTWAWG